MKKLHHSMFVSGVAAIAAAGFLVGCSSDDETEQPSDTGTSVSTMPATTPSAVPPPTTSGSPGLDSQDPEGPAPSPTGGASGSGSTGGGSVDDGGSSGPSQTVSGGISAAPPPVQRSATPPTGDNLPGENAGPQGQPGTPGDDN